MSVGLARDSTMFGSVILARSESAGEIEDREIDAARLLIPHLQRAVAISKLLDVQSLATSSFSAALDSLAVAVILIDEGLRIVYGNVAAQGLIAAADSISSVAGTLTLRSTAAGSALGLAVKQAARHEAQIGRRGFGIPLSGDDGAPRVLHVLPLRHGLLRPGLMPSAVAAVFVAPAVSPASTPIDALAALFDLTAAEARVFAEIAAGKTKVEAARALRVEQSTIKTQLSSVFAKTGTRRQADLVALGASLTLPL